MAKVNWDSIFYKIRVATEDDVYAAVDDAVEKGTDEFVKILTEEMRASGVPESVVEDAASLHPEFGPGLHEYASHKGLKADPSGFYKKIRVDVQLYFDDASRESFSGGPVKNIVNLFDTGTKKIRGKLPAGEWHGERVVALRSRPGAHFMSSAMRRAKQEIEGLSRIGKGFGDEY